MSYISMYIAVMIVVRLSTAYYRGRTGNTNSGTMAALLWPITAIITGLWLIFDYLPLRVHAKAVDTRAAVQADRKLASLIRKHAELEHKQAVHGHILTDEEILNQLIP